MYPSPLPHSKKAGNYLGKGIKYRDSFGFVCDGCFGIWAPGYSIEQHILSPISILSSKWSRLPVDIKSITQIMFTSVDRGGSCASFGLPPRGDDVFLTFCYLLLFIFFSPPLPCCFFLQHRLISLTFSCRSSQVDMFYVQYLHQRSILIHRAMSGEKWKR